jgi:hypothetical protein
MIDDSAVIATRPEIGTLRELDGKKIGVLVNADSGQTGAIVRLAVERAGASASYVGLGTFRNILAALTAGDIDGGALPPDFLLREEDRKRWNCFEARSLAVPVILATTRRAIASDRERVLRTLRGFIESMHRFKTQADVVVPLLQEFLGLSDRTAVERIHAHHASLILMVPRPELANGMQGLRDLLARYPAARGLQETDIVDASLIDELVESGFISRLHANDVGRSPQLH